MTSSNEVTVEITSNGACARWSSDSCPTRRVVESTESFNASNVVTIRTNSSDAWTRPPTGRPRVVALNVRQGANGPIELSLNLTTTR